MNNKSGPRYRQHTTHTTHSTQPTTTIYKCKLIKFTFHFALHKTKIHFQMRNFNCNIRAWTAQRAFSSATASKQISQIACEIGHGKHVIEFQNKKRRENTELKSIFRKTSENHICAILPCVAVTVWRPSNFHCKFKINFMLGQIFNAVPYFENVDGFFFSSEIRWKRSKYVPQSWLF